LFFLLKKKKESSVMENTPGAYYNLEYLYVWILPQNHAETISKC